MIHQGLGSPGGLGETTGTEQALDGGSCRQVGGVGEAAVGPGGVEAGGAGADGCGFGEGFPAPELGEQAFQIGGKANNGLRGGLGQHGGGGAGAGGRRRCGGSHGFAPDAEGGEQVWQFQQGEVRDEMGVLAALLVEEAGQATVGLCPAGAGLGFGLAALLPQFPQQSRREGGIKAEVGHIERNQLRDAAPHQRRCDSKNVLR